MVTGCYATRRPGEVATLPNVVRVVENAGKDTLVEAVAEDLDLTTARRFGDGDGPCGNTLKPGTAGRTALTLRVQTGCEETCSYCIIPSTRGMSRSRPLEYVGEDVRRAVDAGYKEIVMTGVHLGSYGRDLTEGSSLAALIRMLRDWPADVLFGVSSLEPMDCTPEIVEMVASSQRIAPHFHLPLQHGSDAMLRAMRRPYTVPYYRSLIDRIKTVLPHGLSRFRHHRWVSWGNSRPFRRDVRRPRAVAADPFARVPLFRTGRGRMHRGSFPRSMAARYVSEDAKRAPSESGWPDGSESRRSAEPCAD